MIESNIGRLERKRFIISPESLEVMKGIKANFQELQKDYPYLSGISFYGSRIKGLEQNNSDFDAWLFLDNDKIKLKDNIKVVTEMLLPESINPCYIISDISKRRTEFLFNHFVNKNRNHEYKSDLEDPQLLIKNSGSELIPRFFLGIGDDLYNNRRFILDQFRSIDDGEIYFRRFIGVLSIFERFNGRPGKADTPLYKRYPKTIDEAEKYFTIRKSGALPKSEHEYFKRFADRALSLMKLRVY